MCCGSNILKFKHLNDGFVSAKHIVFHFTRRYLDWSLVDYYCDIFICCLDSQFGGTHSLQGIHCEQVM